MPIAVVMSVKSYGRRPVRQFMSERNLKTFPVDYLKNRRAMYPQPERGPRRPGDSEVHPRSRLGYGQKDYRRVC
jgi:hypothetical protein